MKTSDTTKRTLHVWLIDEMIQFTHFKRELTTVSYTHLDVYKRQGYMYLHLWWQQNFAFNSPYHWQDTIDASSLFSLLKCSTAEFIVFQALDFPWQRRQFLIRVCLISFCFPKKNCIQVSSLLVHFSFAAFLTILFFLFFSSYIYSKNVQSISSQFFLMSMFPIHME